MASRFKSFTKQTEISFRLNAINLEIVRKDDVDDYKMVERPSKINDQPAPIVCVKD